MSKRQLLSRSQLLLVGGLLLLMAVAVVFWWAGRANNTLESDELSELTDGEVEEALETLEVTVQGPNVVVTAWVDEAQPEENVSMMTTLETIQVGQDASGKQNFGLIHFDLPAGISASDLVKAELKVKLHQGESGQFGVGRVNVPWAFGIVSWNDVRDAVTFPAQAPLSQQEADNWYQADVTELVADWLSGKAANYGLVLKGMTQGQSASFFSALGEEQPENYPALTLHYQPNPAPEKYGKYGYEQAPDESGNCLSYALRDYDDILADDLIAPADQGALKQALARGEAVALAFLQEKVVAYIQAHQAVLGIESWRILESANDPIDPTKEYLIAMKIGLKEQDEEIGMGAFGNYDFHFRARLDDGRWAEKVPHVASRVTPGSNYSFDTSKYPWDSVFTWGYFKWNDYYDSQAVYFAITKNTDEFTAHKH